MSKFTFVTSSEGKKREILKIIPDSNFIKIDLQEIQPKELSIEGAYEVIESKARSASPYIVEDTSLFIESLNGFPGSLIKYISSEQLCRIIPPNKQRRAVAICLLGVSSDGNSVEVFEGKLDGSISLSPKGKGFGWDDIFIPDGESKTLAELGEEIKINQYSMRTRALKELIGRN